MKKQIINVALSSFVIAASMAVTGCNKSSSSSKNTSRATGWKINAKEGGFQYNSNFKEQETGPGLVFIEGVLSQKEKYRMM